MSSIRDVAKEAGVGVGTVSRALNKTGYVAPATMKKIEKAVRKLEYTPNELARNLYRNRSGIVGLIVLVWLKILKWSYTGRAIRL